MLVKKYHTLFLALAISLSACSNNNDKPAAEAEVNQQPASKVESSEYKPHATKVAQPKSDESLTGTVLETFDSGGYTYLQLDNGQEKIWAAIAASKIEVGQQVALINGPVMQDFYSRSMERTFPEIVFSAGLKGDKATTSASKGAVAPTGHGNSAPAADPHAANSEASFMQALQAGNSKAPIAIDPSLASGGSMKAVVNYQEIKIDKVADGYTVGEIFAKAAELNGKTVKLRGKVVKFSPNIMGSNWLHLQDGSGDPMHNTHDLVVTTEKEAKVDDVVVVEGVMTAKKDFGSGYFYEAIIEKAKIVE